MPPRGSVPPLRQTTPPHPPSAHTHLAAPTTTRPPSLSPSGVEATKELKKELVGSVRSIIGAFAAPDVIHWVRLPVPVAEGVAGAGLVGEGCW